MIRKFIVHAIVESVRGTNWTDPESGEKSPQLTINLGDRHQIQINQDDALYGVIESKLRSGMEVEVECSAIVEQTKDKALESGEKAQVMTGYKKLMGARFLSIKQAEITQVFNDLPDASTKVHFRDQTSRGKSGDNVPEYKPTSETEEVEKF